MSKGCHDTAPVFDGSSPRYRRALLAVIAINASMFAVELSAGVLAGSQALQADALDFLGDTATYALSLYVIGKSVAWRSNAALIKGFSLLAMGLWVFGSTAYQTIALDLPRAEVMGIVGTLALIANVVSVLILLRFRDGDANVRSVWLCSRNDAIGNVAVLIAALGIWGAETAWPDLIVAAGMAGLFIWGACQIIRQARQERLAADFA